MISQERLGDLLRKGISTPDTIGIHGTSLESVRTLLTTGGLPGRTNRNSDGVFNFKTGDFFFYPQLSTFPDGNMLTSLGLNFPDYVESWDEELYDRAVDHANRNAKTHSLIEKLHLDMTNPNHLIAAQDLTDELAYNRFTRLPELVWFGRLFKGPLKYFIDRLATQAIVRRGFLVGIDRSVIFNYNLQKGFEGLDLKINVGRQGLNEKYVSGLLPLGFHERQSLINVLGS